MTCTRVTILHIEAGPSLNTDAVSISLISLVLWGFHGSASSALRFQAGCYTLAFTWLL